MKKLLVISPHFSTGGAPAVTLNKIKLLKDSYALKVVEYSFLSWQFVVQRNAVIELVGEENFYSLSGNKKEQLINILDDFQPDVVALEEFPEMFMDRDAADYLYSHENRPYLIETTHDSSFNPHHKRYQPDEFVFVSAYNELKYSHLPVKSSIIEFPVDFRTRNKYQAQSKLGLEKGFKHIVIIGLFTPRKNQAYAFELAKKLLKYNLKFHFLGNQAENFADYWKPLMDKKPENCIVWGERSDVSTFLEAADLFLFPSKGDRGNKELNPIVIKEAQQYKDLPKLMYNLDVYLNKYIGMSDFHFLSGNADEDAEKIINITESTINKTDVSEELIIIGTYPNLKKREELTIECLKSLKPLKRKILLISHYPVSAEIQKLADFYIYDAENTLTHHSYYTHFFRETNEYYAQININGLKDTNQSLSVLMNLFTAAKFAKNLGFSRFFYNTYDVILHEKDISCVENGFLQIAGAANAYLGTLNTPFEKGIQTNGMFFKTDFFLETFDDVRNAEKYNDACKKANCHNFLEDYLINKLKGKPDVFYIYSKNETLLKNSGLGVSSNSEYYSIIPIEDEENSFMFYFYTYNIDHRTIDVEFDCGEKQRFTIELQKQNEFKHRLDYVGLDINISLKFNDLEKIYKTENFVINQETKNSYKNNGIYRSKIRPKSKIKLVHLQTTINDEREQKSREQLSKVGAYDWQYVLHTNKPYMDLPPKFNCQRPDCVSMVLFDEQRVQQLGTALTPAHYGCYQAFKNAILAEFDSDLDYLIVCEGDCKLELEIEEFVKQVEEIAYSIRKHHIGFHSFGDAKTLEHGWMQSPVVEEINDKAYITNHLIGLQCVMFPKRVRNWLKDKLINHDWDAADMYFNSIFYGSKYKMSIVKNRLTTQFDGYSLIDKQEKIFK